MQEIKGDLFESVKANAICITTNGVVSSRGTNVMGRGSAGKAKELWPGIELTLGGLIQSGGNRVHQITREPADSVAIPPELKHLQAVLQPSLHTIHYLPYHVVSFPTKPSLVTEPAQLLRQYSRDPEGHCCSADGTISLPGWMAKSDLLLIEKSACQLSELTDQRGWQSVVLPRPGCGNGELSWTEVRSILSSILDDRFYVISFK
jgi:hypothetical protein